MTKFPQQLWLLGHIWMSSGGYDAANQPDLLGLRDRALIAMMVYSFARIGAVIQMKVGDYFIQGRRRRIRVHEKGGKEYDIIAQHLNDLDFR